MPKKKLILPRIPFQWQGPKLTKARLNNVSLDLELPSELLRVLLWRNGGVPSSSYFYWHHPKSGNRVSKIDRVFGFDPRPFDDPARNGDIVWAIMKFRYWLPQWSIPIAFVDEDNFLVTFCNYDERANEVWMKRWSHEEPDRFPAEKELHRVSTSIVEFVCSLQNAP